ncbi:hypothetical protein ABK040_004834 [Willaertia magna]
MLLKSMLLRNGVVGLTMKKMMITTTPSFMKYKKSPMTFLMNQINIQNQIRNRTTIVKNKSLYLRQKPSMSQLEGIAEPYVPTLYSKQHPISITNMKQSAKVIWFRVKKYFSKLRGTFRIYKRLGKKFGFISKKPFLRQAFAHLQEFRKAIVSGDLKKLNKVCTNREISAQKRDYHELGKDLKVELNEISSNVRHCFVLDIPGGKEIAQVVTEIHVNEKIHSNEGTLLKDENHSYYVVFEKPLEDYSKEWLIAGFIEPSNEYFEPALKDLVYGTSQQ